MTECIQILESAAVIIASLVAIFGVMSWKREIKWKRESAFNEEVLFCFYACQEKIRHIRSFVMFDIENANYTPSEKLTQRQNESLGNAQVFFDRYKQNVDTFNNLHKLKLLFKAIYPNKSLEPFNTIEECVGDVLRAARILGTHYWHIDNTGKSTEEAENNNKKIAEYESIIYYEYSDPDIIDNKISDAIKQIELSLIITPNLSWFQKIKPKWKII